MNYLIALIVSVTSGLIFAAVIYVSFNDVNKHIVIPEKHIQQEILNDKNIDNQGKADKKLWYL